MRPQSYFSVRRNCIQISTIKCLVMVCVAGYFDGKTSGSELANTPAPLGVLISLTPDTVVLRSSSFGIKNRRILEDKAEPSCWRLRRDGVFQRKRSRNSEQCDQL